MTALRLILHEIAHRKVNFILGLLAVVTAVALFVGFFTTATASQRETARIMRDLGFNVRILHEDTDMQRFWTQGYSDLTMPEEYVHRFATQKDIAYTHLLATLQRQVEWDGQEMLLTGIAPEEVSPLDKQLAPMTTSWRIEEGGVYVGYEAARAFGLEEGGEVDLLGRTMRVVRILAETGSRDDIRITMNLADAQQLLEEPERINEIQALECICRDPDKDSLDILREQIQEILPGTHVVQLRSMAKARERQRLMLEEYFAFLVPMLVVVCAAWIGVLAWINVRDRQEEIGILRALGYGTGRIAALFLGKAVLTGLVGALLGYFIGSALALHYGPQIFQITAGRVAAMPGLLAWSVVLAPAFAALSSFIPTVLAVTHDPADTLRPE